MQRLREELHARSEGDEACNMQGLLDQHKEENSIQEQKERHKADRVPGIMDACG
jgi:hypothetical protein